jgi:hypothetical protein
MDFFCIRRHIGLFLIFWMSLSKRPSTSSAQAIQALNKSSTLWLVETIAWAKAGPFSSAAFQPLFSVDHGFGFSFSFLGCFLPNL